MEDETGLHSESKILRDSDILFKDFWVKGTTSKTFLILRRLWRWRWAIAGDRGWEREALPGMRNRPGMR